MVAMGCEMVSLWRLKKALDEAVVEMSLPKFDAELQGRSNRGSMPSFYLLLPLLQHIRPPMRGTPVWYKVHNSTVVIRHWRSFRFQDHQSEL